MCHAAGAGVGPAGAGNTRSPLLAVQADNRLEVLVGLPTLCRVLEVSLVELSLRAWDAAFFREEADSVSVLALGVRCCVRLQQAEEGADAAVGWSRGGTGGSEGGSQQAVPCSAAIRKLPVLGLPGDFYFLPSWLCCL